MMCDLAGWWGLGLVVQGGKCILGLAQMVQQCSECDGGFRMQSAVAGDRCFDDGMKGVGKPRLNPKPQQYQRPQESCVRGGYAVVSIAELLSHF